jgi:hypothetical protein
LAAAAAVVLAAGAGLMARAQDAAKAPPSWDTLVRCAGMADTDSRLSCYDAAMRAAGYEPKPAEVQAEKRRRFGLSFPEISLMRRHAKEEGAQAVAANNSAPAAAPASAGAAAAPATAPPAAKVAEDDENEVSVQLDTVARVEPTNRLLLFTTDGAIWAQTDDEMISPSPKSGQTIVIKRNRFGGYFCQFDKRNAVRCVRKR